jgi:hypothetical protein
MNADVKSQLKQVLGAYDVKLAELERVEAAKRATQAAFPERFTRLKTETIRPALQEFADVLNAGGHEATVKDENESSTTASGIRWSAIWLRIVPKPFAHEARAQTSPSAIEVTFSANRNDGKITVSSTNTMSGTAGSVGKRGSYEIDALTADVIATHVLKTLEEAFV